MAEDKLRWSDLEPPGKYLKADHLQEGQEVTLEIDEVQVEEMADGKKKGVMYFRNWPRKLKDMEGMGLVLNVGNGREVADTYGMNIEDSYGQPIILYRVWTEYAGKRTPGLRLRAPGSKSVSEPIQPEQAAQGPPEDDIPF